MKLGVQLGFFPARWPLEPRVRLIREAEALGYDSLWAAESTGCDAATLLAFAAAHTERVRIGTAVLQMPGRSAAMTAMTAVGLDRLSGGRLNLGIGASTRPVAEDWHGQDYARQLQRTREYVAQLRLALGGERLAYEGELQTMPRSGAPIRMTDGPVQEHVPILIGAIGPRNLALCGEIADGWIATMAAPEHVRKARSLIAEGAAAAGRTLPEDFAFVVHMITAIDDDHAAARDAARPMLAVYAGIGGPERNLYRRLFDRLGFEAEAEAAMEHFQAGRVAEARAAVPDALIDTIAVCGPPDHVAARLDEYRAAGVTTLMANFMTSDPEGWEANLRALAAAGELAR